MMTLIARALQGRVIKHSLPLNLEKKDVTIFRQLQLRKIEEVNIFKLREVNVLPNGFIFRGLNMYKLFMLENDEGHIGYLNWKGLLKVYLSSKKKILSKDNNYILVHNIYSHSYYHWLLEVLPRLFLLKEYLSNGTLLLPKSYQSSFHSESLAFFYVRNIELLRDNVYYKVPRLTTASPIGRVANYHPEAIQKTAMYFRSRVKSQLDAGRRIYVSREKAAKRKVLNELVVIDVLKYYGFTVVNFELFSFEEQVSMMSKCQYIVGCHGAGLSNMIFMPPGGTVLELRKFDYGENYFFYTLSSIIGHNYYYQFCSSPVEKMNVQDADIEVDVELLQRNLNLIFCG